MIRFMALAVGTFWFLSVSSDAKEIEGPIATVDFEKGYDKGAGFGRATLQTFNLVDEEKCWKIRQIGFVTALASKRKARRIPAGRLVQIFAYTRHDNIGVSGTCVSRIAFVPTVGGHYSMKQVAVVGRYCTMEVIDSSTGKAPPDLEHIDPESCKQSDSEKEEA